MGSSKGSYSAGSYSEGSYSESSYFAMAMKAMKVMKVDANPARKVLGDMKIMRNRMNAFVEIKRWPKATQDRNTHS